MKIKTFVHQKILLTVKRQFTEWEKIIANHISDKIMRYRIHRELLNLKDKKPKQPNSKIGNGFG